MKIFIVGALFISVAFPAIGQTNEMANTDATMNTNVTALLPGLERQWADAVVHKDVETINRLQADEFEFVDPGGGTWTKARSLEFIRSGQLQIDSFEMTGFKVRVYGNTAIVNYRVVWNGKSGGNDISGPQRVTDVFVLRGKDWQCVSSQTTRIVP